MNPEQLNTPEAITPIPIPAGTPLVVLIGGTFDPPHRAHVTLPLRARDMLESDAGVEGRAWVVYIPAARSPHKDQGPVATNAQRRRMLELALADHPRTAIWTDELDRSAREPRTPSYTSETVSRARRWLDANAGASTRLRLLIGADQAAAFHRWHDPRTIIALAEPAVMLRAPLVSTELLMNRLGASGDWSPAELRQWGSRVLEGVDRMDAAATSARRELNAPTPDHARLAEILDPRVLEYIRASGTYAGR